MDGPDVTNNGRRQLR